MQRLGEILIPNVPTCLSKSRNGTFALTSRFYASVCALLVDGEHSFEVSSETSLGLWRNCQCMHPTSSEKALAVSYGRRNHQHVLQGAERASMV